MPFNANQPNPLEEHIPWAVRSFQGTVVQDVSQEAPTSHCHFPGKVLEQPGTPVIGRQAMELSKQSGISLGTFFHRGSVSEGFATVSQVQDRCVGWPDVKPTAATAVNHILIRQDAFH